jgi:Uncharacterized conserved protein (some members contain a von Willebrand factor type A (vWA) domain)
MAPLAAAPPPDGSPAAAFVGPRGARPATLENALDPTVFDETFLRQLERLKLLLRQAVRGGLKGGRRSVKRGRSVEFADYREYTLGDDLRQLDWNVYARLERLFVKLPSASSSMPARRWRAADRRSSCSPSGRPPPSGRSGWHRRTGWSSAR